MPLSTPVARRLAAILAADVVGYSRLVELDEAGTIAGLKRLRNRVVEPLIAAHHGRLVQVVGDGLLVEFASVVDAVLVMIHVVGATLTWVAVLFIPPAGIPWVSRPPGVGHDGRR